MAIKTQLGETKFKTEPLKGSLAMKIGYNWGRKFYDPFVQILQNTFQNFSEIGQIDLASTNFAELAVVFVKSGSAASLKDFLDKVEYDDLIDFLTGGNLDGCEGGLLASTKVLIDDEYVPIDFDRDFAGILDVAFKLAWFVLGVNFPFIAKLWNLSGIESSEEPVVKIVEKE